MVNSFRAEVLCRNCRSEIGVGKIAKPDFFVPEVSFRQYCQKSDSPVDLSACEKVPPVGGIGVRGMPPASARMYIRAMLATSSAEVLRTLPPDFP